MPNWVERIKGRVLVISRLITINMSYFTYWAWGITSGRVLWLLSSTWVRPVIELNGLDDKVMEKWGFLVAGWVWFWHVLPRLPSKSIKMELLLGMLSHIEGLERIVHFSLICLLRAQKHSPRWFIRQKRMGAHRECSLVDPWFNHLLFADDSILFSRVRVLDCLEIRQILGNLWKVIRPKCKFEKK